MGGLQEVRREGRRIKVGGRETVSNDTSEWWRGKERGMFQLQLRHRSPPVISASPSATRYIRCVCWTRLCLSVLGEHQRGRKASQDACPTVALVVQSSEASPRVMGLQSNLSTRPPVSHPYLFQLTPRGRLAETASSFYGASMMPTLSVFSFLISGARHSKTSTRYFISLRS